MAMNQQDRLRLIASIYEYFSSEVEPNGNACREYPTAWDLCQVFGAIATGYRIQLNPRYKGVRLLRKNQQLWEKVSPFVVLKAGQGCLPHDEGALGERWKQLNPGRGM